MAGIAPRPSGCSRHFFPWCRREVASTSSATGTRPTTRPHTGTIAFGRRLNALVERLALMAIWRNFVKRRSERRPEPVTPAMRVGLASEVWDWRRVFSRRLFPERESLSPVTERLYRREWTTPIYPRNTRHLLKHAY